MMPQTVLEAPAPTSPPLDKPEPALEAGLATKKPPRLRPARLAAILAAAAAAVVALFLTLPALYGVSTDDAYVQAHIVSVVPKLAAYVSAVHIDDNSSFAAGDLLVELDPRDFEVAVESASADRASAQANAANVEAQLTEQKAIIQQAEAAISADRGQLEFARQELARYQDLARTGAGTTQRWQQAQSDIAARQGALQRDLAALDATRAHVAVLQTQGQQAQAAIDRQKAALAQAKLNLSYTKIFAVEAGSVANKNVEVGNFVQPGQILFSAVPRAPYVVANYKENQIENIRPGQPATITVDAFPGLRLRGRVDSIQRGTGSQFALLPPENATGNFVKVVQRIPVKLTFDDPAEALRWISPGMSVETIIFFRTPPRWLRFAPTDG
jgi:membrane fusion protein (multidrug efflux system)